MSSFFEFKQIMFYLILKISLNIILIAHCTRYTPYGCQQVGQHACSLFILRASAQLHRTRDRVPCTFIALSKLLTRWRSNKHLKGLFCSTRCTEKILKILCALLVLSMVRYVCANIYDKTISLYLRNIIITTCTSGELPHRARA